MRSIARPASLTLITSPLMTTVAVVLPARHKTRLHAQQAAGPIPIQTPMQTETLPSQSAI